MNGPGDGRPRGGQGTALHVADCGDAAVRVSCPSPDREHAWQTVHAVGTWLNDRRHLHHVHGAVPTYDAVLVEFDPEFTDHDTVATLVRSAAARSGQAPRRTPNHFEIPVVYGGEHGPDLARVAEQQGLDVERVVAIHSAQALVMRCYGAPAGAPMLDGPRFPHPVPRLASPRPHVPGGASRWRDAKRSFRCAPRPAGGA